MDYINAKIFSRARPSRPKFVVKLRNRVDLKTCKPIPHLHLEDEHMSDLICYCFEYTNEDIKQDFSVNGRSLIMEKIMAEKKMGACQCTTKNPKGK